MKQQKLLLVVAAVIVLLGIFYLLRPRSTPDLNLVLVPSAAHAKLDGKNWISDGKAYVTPGHHTLTVSFNGFATQTTSFDIVKDKLKTVTVALGVSSDEGRDWLIAHPDEAKKLEQLTGSAFSNSTQQRVTKLPLIKELPYIERYFRIDYGKSKLHPDDDNAVAIYITTYGQPGVQQALDWIRSQGYNPNTLEIIYNDQSDQSSQ